jgi:RHS repeat-associated protein
VTICEQTGVNDPQPFARSNYKYHDLTNNLKSISREEDENKGELFGYDDANQLKSVSYKADIAPDAPGGGSGGAVATVEEDEEREAIAALEADPVREPLAEGVILLEAPSQRTVLYTNDALNRLSMNDNGAVTSYTPNHLNQYTAVTDHGTLSYDTKFSLSVDDGWNYTYDAEKRLISATTTGHSAQFGYDGIGRCVKRTIDGATTVFTYDNWKPIVEWEFSAGTVRLVAWNLYGAGADEILVRNQPNTGGYLYYHLDAQGNVQFLLSDTLHGLEKNTYDVFGKPTIMGWNETVPRAVSQYGNRFLFTGREYLYTLELYDYRHRIYNPELGRFIQTDPLGLQIEGEKLTALQTALYVGETAPATFASSELNLYRYCNNDPVNKTDPTGLYVTYGGKWSDSDVKAFQAEFAKWWADPIGRANLTEFYSSSDEIRFTPIHGFFGGNKGFGMQAFDNQGREKTISLDQTNHHNNAPSVAGAQGSGNFEKMRQGDNTAANKQAHDAAREGGIRTKDQMRQFHDTDKTGMSYQRMVDLAKEIAGK